MTNTIETGNSGGLSRRRLIGGVTALTGLTAVDATVGVGRAGGRSLMDHQASGSTARGVPRLTPIVETAHGKVRGYSADGVHTFRGLRYGAPTSGNNRFKPPVRPAAWTQVMETYIAAGGSIAPQVLPDFQRPIRWSTELDPDGPPMSEDCLFLNLFTPGVNDGGKRPVMVWLHGGAWEEGCGCTRLFDGTHLARHGDAVIIAINHRLGLLGYLYLAELLGEDYADSGNSGVLDIIAALRWVKENVSNFGGDPGNVTLFGWSSGGSEVCQVLAMPEAEGLFHKAIVQSGAQLALRSREAAARASEEVLGRLGLTRARARKILDLPMDALLKGGSGGQPTFDGRSVPRQLWEPDAPPTAFKVPLMIGGTDSELSMVGPDSVYELDEREVSSRVEHLLGGEAAAVLSAYRRGHPDATPGQLLVFITTGLWTTKRTAELAERKAASGGAPVYVYRWTWRTPLFGGKYLSPHGVDLPLVWDNVASGADLVGSGPRPQEVADRVSARWLAFARTGEPNAPDLVTWKPYTASRRETLVIDQADRLVGDPHRAERLALARVPQSTIFRVFSALRA